MVYLGIDYGLKYIGLARSDEGGTIAFPVESIANDDRALSFIQNLCHKEHVETLVIGASYDQDGNPNAVMESITAFRVLLEASVGLPIHFEKEAFTSVHARQASGKEGRVDSHAAALILQRYLDRVQVQNRQ